MSLEDRISVCYRYNIHNHVRTITDIVNVSYDLERSGKWITIIHYDSIHVKGFIHVHLLENFTEKNYIEFFLDKTSSLSSLGKWLTQLQKHLRENYDIYKNDALYRSQNE